MNSLYFIKSEIQQHTQQHSADQPGSMHNNSTMDEDDGHARVLRALHGEILAHGLVSAQGVVPGGDGVKICDAPHENLNNSQHKDVEVEAATATAATATTPVSFAQSATGAFPPLRYTDCDGRLVVVRALGMFDDLIVNATATPPPLPVGGMGVGGGGKGDIGGDRKSVV